MVQLDGDSLALLGELVRWPRQSEYVSAEKLSELTGLDADRLNAAVEELLDLELVETLSTFQPDHRNYFFSDVVASNRGRAQIARLLATRIAHPSAGADGTSGTGSVKPNALSAVKIFISHSSKDVEVAKRTVDLLRAATCLPSRAIRCTSVPGYKLEAGADTEKRLRAEVTTSDVLVGILSASSMQSIWVAFELGARWGGERPIVPLVVAGITPKDLPAPLSGRNALRADKREDVVQFVIDVARSLDMQAEPSHVYEEQLNALVAAAGETQALTETTGGTEATGPLQVEMLSVLELLAPGIMVDSRYIAESCKLSSARAHHAVDTLLERELISELRSTKRPTRYKITAGGRSFLFDRGLLK